MSEQISSVIAQHLHDAGTAAGALRALHSSEVANHPERQGAYTHRSKAETDFAAAHARLNAASEERDKVIAALDALNRPRRKI